MHLIKHIALETERIEQRAGRHDKIGGCSDKGEAHERDHELAPDKPATYEDVEPKRED